VSEHLPRMMDLLASHPLIDGHNDLVWEARVLAGYDFDVLDLSGRTPTQTDWPRAASGRLGGQFWSVYVPGTLPPPDALVATLEQIDGAKRMIARYPDRLALALTAADVEATFASGRIASLLGAEGGHSIASSLGVLRQFYALGVRYLTLTHNQNVGWADSATDVPDTGGLSAFGEAVVRELNALGMLVDLSHVSDATMRAALSVTRAPVMFSHSGARSVCSAPRNVPDDVLAELPGNGGVCMAVFARDFVSQECWDHAQGGIVAARAAGLDPTDISASTDFKRAWEREHPGPEATLAQVADQIERLRDVAGVAHVGIGGDFDGVTHLPVGLEDVSCYPALFAELAGRGWSDPDLIALAGGNILRVMRDAEAVAAAS
jgi:membrane dipeptidase